jgi:hypothetical protein
MLWKDLDRTQVATARHDRVHGHQNVLLNVSLVLDIHNKEKEHRYFFLGLIEI